jgi:hypothetical protein
MRKGGWYCKHMNNLEWRKAWEMQERCMKDDVKTATVRLEVANEISR